ncbi:MAG TPA: hypothetical protein VJ788_06800 [Gemmatimonadota bacterium]|nr:hypothetical protein [Gemmatimonadota bacterium]
MKTIEIGIAVGIALFGWAANGTAAPEWNGPGLGFAPADSLEIPGVLAVFEPGVLVRTRFAECGDELRPVKEITGRFVAFEHDAFQVEVGEGIHTQLHQVAIDDVLRLELGVERPRTTRGAVIGGLTGVLLGAVVIAADGADGGAFDSGGAEYAVGTAMFGLIGAGVGALIGGNTESVEWRPIPLYGQAYAQ